MEPIVEVFPLVDDFEGRGFTTGERFERRSESKNYLH
jgi:hypothetical protein